MGQKFVITESEKNYIRGLYSHILKEVEEGKPSQTCQEWIEQNWSDKIPYTDVYKRGKCKFDLQEYVEKRIRDLKPIEYAQSLLPDAKQFYIDYFDYNKNPEILDKIIMISEKNGKKTSKENIIKVIESMKSDLFNKVNFELDFTYNEKSPDTLMLTDSAYGPKIFICGLSSVLFVDDYKIGDLEDWKNTIQHELGHLIDNWFANNGIILHKGVRIDSGIVPFPHQSMANDNYLMWGEYQRDTDEQFVRFKTLFNILSKYGLTISSDLNTFVTSIKKAMGDKTISFEGCPYSIEHNVIKLDENCESLKDRVMYVLSNGKINDDLVYLFSNYTMVDDVFDGSKYEEEKVDYTVNLDAMYNDWKNEYVQNSKKTNSATSSPNYPTA
jgi:uncharacterized protein YbdZ (MbtH family)